MTESQRKSLEALLRDPRIWRCGQGAAAATETVPTGFAALDAQLGGGWPVGALTEILSAVEGIGALGLVMPALAQLSQSERWLAWLAPPHHPYAPALAAHGVDLRRVLVLQEIDRPPLYLWGFDQSLRGCGAVLAWSPPVDWRGLRRLQLAAEAGHSLGFIFRPLAACREASPAALRMMLASSGALTSVRIIKRRGGASAPLLILDPRARGVSG